MIIHPLTHAKIVNQGRTSFDQLFAGALRSLREPPRQLGKDECQSASGQRCTLCAASSIGYATEVTLKQQALHEFWRDLETNVQPDTLVRSPLGREYRAITKRKIFHGRDSVGIGLIDPSERDTGKFDVLRCAIEPADHALVYAAVRTSLLRPSMENFVAALRYVIIKGTYAGLTVIFNVAEISPRIIRAANDLSKTVSKASPKIVGTFLYEGDDEGRYYQGTRNPRGRQTLRKLFGKPQIALTVAGKQFRFSPLSFSQINQSMIGHLLKAAGDLLGQTTESALYDLYCGYGLFALSLADRFRRVTGVERSPESIDAARENAVRFGAKNAQFVRNDITSESLAKVLHSLSPSDAVLLDPPRGGTLPGVIECIAAKGPAKIVHIFCNIDLVPQDLLRWQAGGYNLLRALPLDLFPGIPDIEVLMLFERPGK